MAMRADDITSNSFANVSRGRARVELAEEGELGLRRDAAAEGPEHRSATRPRRCGDAHVIFAVGLKHRSLKQRTSRDVGHPLTDFIFVVRVLRRFNTAVDAPLH